MFLEPHNLLCTDFIATSMAHRSVALSQCPSLLIDRHDYLRRMLQRSRSGRNRDCAALGHWRGQGAAAASARRGRKSCRQHEKAHVAEPINQKQERKRSNNRARNHLTVPYSEFQSRDENITKQHKGQVD